MDELYDLIETITVVTVIYSLVCLAISLVEEGFIYVKDIAKKC